MKKTAYALALVTFILIGAHPLLAADMASPPVANSNLQIVAPVAQSAGIFSFPDDFGWLQTSIVTDAHAGSTVAMPAYNLAHAEKEQQQVPLTTGAWLMGGGLVAFIISRKRFRT